MPRENQYSASDYADMIMLYGECHYNARDACRVYAERYPNRARHPNHRVILGAAQRLWDTGNILPARVERVGRPRDIRNLRNEDRVVDAVENDPHTSVRKLERQLQISRTSINPITKARALHPFHATKVQKLGPGDFEQRIAFCNRILEMVANDPDFLQRVLWTDESLTTNGHWKFVPGTDNPADCATRGLTTSQLKTHQLWWSGPSWLLEDSPSWPTSPIHKDADTHLEERPVKSLYVLAQPLNSSRTLMERPIPLLRMLRVTAICGRVRDMIKRIPHSTLARPLTSTEINLALQFCIKETQRIHFYSELQLLAKQASWPKDHPFARLVAYQDTDGIIQVGGRLENAPNSDQQKHPAILPRDAALTRLVISDAHQCTMHGGTQLTLAHTRLRYWIIGGRQPVRSHILKCLVCARHRGVRAQQLMGQLPTQRVTPAPPFSHTGVDYAGPVSIKSWKGRGSRIYKGWICVFVCLTTSAVYVDLVSDYSSSGL
ncbi:uncharacterized protein LOC130670526 [Microplitis mediator]|uniref:uncharacterized protein LOC130670526 n=1 Tax=Microplitis mediator TaxID=375433 RepID=UPI0025549541|nr:uncharacterized protein LOC130670526 [Microplitis mediator]